MCFTFVAFYQTIQIVIQSNHREMKKLVLLFAVAASMAVVACGNKGEAAAEATDNAVEVAGEAVEAVEAVVPDSAASETPDTVVVVEGEVAEAPVAE